MKKKLLFGTALLAAISAFPQSGLNRPQPSGTYDLAERLARKYELINNAAERGAVAGRENNVRPSGAASQAGRASTTVGWMPLSGSVNIYGVLVSSSKPLQYNDELNAVSFVHRKSFTYVPSPVQTSTGSSSGVIVASVANDLMGANNIAAWDSTVVWNNASQWARYPQGGIYNPPGNTSLANAYMVATGPITQANNTLGWIGSFFASKKLDTYNNVASTASGAQQFIANTSPYAPGGKFDYPRADFSVTDNGVVRSLGVIANNVNNTGTVSAYGWRGASIVKGAFSSGAFTWSSDSIVPPVLVSSLSGGLMANGQPHMAWNETGSVGYVWFIGCRTGATNNNTGFQPIVFKSTNFGATWSLMPGIDFNSSYFDAPVLNHLDAVRNNTALTIPQFNASEGIDAVVDGNDRLHIVATLLATSKSHPDSLGFTYLYTNADGERYNSPHRPGQRPYIYDFTETASGWNVMMIDSMSSEAPGETLGANGYALNPWDGVGGTSGTDKVSSDARIQASRTPDGQYIVYTWAETDTAFTTNSTKWNNFPNVKVRAFPITGTLSPTEINITNPLTGSNPLVASHAQMHFVSPKCKAVSTGTAQFTLVLPITVSNNQDVPMTQLLPCTHWYSSAELSFSRYGVGIAENALSSVNNSRLYPNPAQGSASLLIDLEDNQKVELKVIDLLGSVVKSLAVEAQAGENNLDIALGGLPAGIYMVTIKAGNAQASKKLIIE